MPNRFSVLFQFLPEAGTLFSGLVQILCVTWMLPKVKTVPGKINTTQLELPLRMLAVMEQMLSEELYGLQLRQEIWCSLQTLGCWRGKNLCQELLLTPKVEIMLQEGEGGLTDCSDTALCLGRDVLRPG